MFIAIADTVLMHHLKQGGLNKVYREIAEYLLECVKDVNPPASGNKVIVCLV